jgi:hypothetical protein
MATSAGKPTANGVCAYTVSFWARIRGPNHLFRHHSSASLRQWEQLHGVFAVYGAPDLGGLVQVSARQFFSLTGTRLWKGIRQ